MRNDLKAIVCVDCNWAIGKDNHLLFHLSGDMKHFREKTKNQTVLMGRKTLMSLPHPQKGLPHRTNIILSRDSELHNTEHYFVAHNLNELSQLLEAILTDQNIFIIGGAKIYELLLPYCDTIYVTKVFNKYPNADTFFPNLFTLSNWKLTDSSQIQIETDHNNNLQSYVFLKYEKINGNP